MMIKRILIGLLTVVLFASCSLNARITKADKKFALGEYYRAAEMYRSIYPNVPTKKRVLKADVAYKMGNAYRIVENNKRAETAFKNAVKYGCKDSLLTYYYAEVLRRNGKYKEAIKMYYQYEQMRPGNELAKNGIESCEKAIADWEKITAYEIIKDPTFNSKYSEFCPAFASADGDVLYFNSTRVARGAKKTKTSRITGQRNNDIYSSKTNAQGKWESPNPLEGEINTEFDEGTCSFSADGQELYYTLSKVVKGETLGAAIYMCKRNGGAWSEPQKLQILKDSSITTAHPALSRDGAYLYFFSDIDGGFGGRDIWRVAKTGDGWDIPENLGPTINTKGEEMFPYFRADGVMYFSSDGHPGLGGLDIFAASKRPKAKFSDADEWDVVNLLKPINSNFDDFGISFAGKQDWGFFSSNRNDRKGYDHIYKFSKPVLNFSVVGVITDSKGENLGDARVRMVGNDGSIANIQTKKNGSYTASINKNTKYVLLATCRGFLNSKKILDVADLEKSQNFTMDFQLNSVSKPVKMNNIFFKFGSAELTPESSAGLDELVELLKDNPNITIEIGAHTDFVGSDETNLLLSGQRAKSVVDYLTVKGIEKDRLSSKGYGESVPVVPDKALVKQYRFLKVDTPLNNEFIEGLKSEEQEIANQINRRTECKVLKTTYKMY